MHQNKEFANLVSLLESNIKENITLGLVVAQNYQKEFEAHFGCRIEEYEDMMAFLEPSVAWGQNPYWSYKPKIIKMKYLDLEFTNIHQIPKGIGMLKNLKILILDYNYLRNLPKEIGKLENLKRLFLNFNQIIEIPKEIGQLKNLEILDFDSNKITNIPLEITDLKNLQKLFVSNNLIKAIPEEIKAMQYTQGLKIYADEGLL